MSTTSHGLTTSEEQNAGMSEIHTCRNVPSAGPTRAMEPVHDYQSPDFVEKSYFSESSIPSQRSALSRSYRIFCCGSRWGYGAWVAGMALVVIALIASTAIVAKHHAIIRPVGAAVSVSTFFPNTGPTFTMPGMTFAVMSTMSGPDGESTITLTTTSDATVLFPTAATTEVDALSTSTPTVIAATRTLPPLISTATVTSMSTTLLVAPLLPIVSYTLTYSFVSATTYSSGGTTSISTSITVTETTLVVTPSRPDFPPTWAAISNLPGTVSVTDKPADVAKSPTVTTPTRRDMGFTTLITSACTSSATQSHGQ